MSTHNYDTPTIKIIYKTGLLLIVPAILGCLFLHTDIAERLFLLTGRECAIKKATGLPCPGCGGTRAAFLLAYFHILQSIKFNASVFFGALFYVIFMATEVLHFKRGTKGFSETGFFVMFYLWLAIILIQWIAKLKILLF